MGFLLTFGQGKNVLTRFLSICYVSFLETVRQPVFGVGLIATAILLFADLSLAAFTLDDDNKLLLDLQLATLLGSGLFLASFSATGVLSREIENKTVLTVISKPVSRPLFFLAKFAGVSLALILAHYLSTLFMIMVQRQGAFQTASTPWHLPVLIFGFGGLLGSLLVAAFCNYFYQKDFPLTAIKILTPVLTIAILVSSFWSAKFEFKGFLGDFVGGPVLIAAYLVLLINLILTSLALAASTRLGQVATLSACTLFLGIGLTTDYFLRQLNLAGSFAAGLYTFVPNFGPFWVVDALNDRSDETYVPLIYVGWTSLYAILICLGLTSLGMLLFQRREVG